MAMNSKNIAMPKGTKFKVIVEKEGKTDFMMLYAESEEDALAKVEDACKGTSLKAVRAERATN